jgi:hypothetical protein
MSPHCSNWAHYSKPSSTHYTMVKVDHGSLFHSGQICPARKGAAKHGGNKTAKLTELVTERVLQRLACSDITLQATTKQRRYMRRGSKTPAMLMLSVRLGDEIEIAACSSAVPSPRSEAGATHQGQHKNHARKLSAVSLLSHQLHTANLLEHAAGVLPPRPNLVERQQSGKE